PRSDHPRPAGPRRRGPVPERNLHLLAGAGRRGARRNQGGPASLLVSDRDQDRADPAILRGGGLPPAVRRAHRLPRLPHAQAHRYLIAVAVAVAVPVAVAVAVAVPVAVAVAVPVAVAVAIAVPVAPRFDSVTLPPCTPRPLSPSSRSPPPPASSPAA